MSKCFVVLGMHRSATSLVAGSLHENGVNMGEQLLGANQHNPKGHYENIEFMQLNMRILQEAGGNWCNPPSREDILAVDVEDEIIDLIERSKDDLWGWKDPRTTLTIEKYLPYIENPHFVTMFREPKEVAKSLNRRSGRSIEEGLKLANEYNERLTNFLSRWCKNN